MTENSIEAQKNDMDSKKCYQAISIEKDYVGVPVLKGVSLTIHPGEIVGLVGHNGAGKSTLLRVLSGAHRQSGGSLRLDGAEVSFSDPSEAIEQGISTVYQELSLMPNLTVAQNMWLGREERNHGRLLDKKNMITKAKKVIGDFGLDVDVEKQVGSYSVATRQLLEIAIACSKNTRYLLLDEPTTSLEGDQVTSLMDYLKQLATTKNIGILIVNHKLDELYQVADRIVALMNGQVVIDAPTATVDRNAVVTAIAGVDYAKASEGAENATSEKKHSDGKTTLRVKHINGGILQDISFTAKSGQILGIYGLGGAGKSETLRAIAGIAPAKGGEIEVDGKPFAPKVPKDAMKRGIAFLTEERKKDGIVPLMSSYQNAGLPELKRYSKSGFLNKSKMRQDTGTILKQLGLKGAPENPVESLSGGNQQKVLLARALAQRPHILLLDEPSKGVDIGAKEEIHVILRSLAQQNDMTIVMVSSEEEEILDISDEVLVLGEGKVLAGPFPVGQVSQSQLRKLAWS
ncbi:sugar ABC transporter ATP-binding protein [Bifidobacterium sp. ESL0690]|uniref:sugar ABC transporter ATP-binding protein n=1 Tax=Bifidobacterium sp. ESL0690 TaxID=2983214 RepID=UPI0023F872E0|nr:sugar ABC transporter ATP-binding protein [Bifidobacterium sp. ESL0690]WEV46878.1 sugar ABC transporter ATP-binding protein [Bifidobacterium sp. ESL0690]